MKLFFSLIICLLLNECESLKVLSYNIQHGANMQKAFNLTGTIETIKSINPDIIGLQEVDLNTKRVPLDETKTIADSCSYDYYLFAKMRKFEGGDYGVAIVSRFPIINHTIFYYHPPGKQPQSCTNDPTPDDYCQGALAVQVDTPYFQFPVWIVTTHLGLGLELEEATQLYGFLKQFVEFLVIVTGDFNAIPTSDAMSFLTQYTQDQWAQCGKGDGFTFSSADPVKRIDYQLLYPSANMLYCKLAKTVDSQSSDHLPLVVTYGSHA